MNIYFVDLYFAFFGDGILASAFSVDFPQPFGPIIAVIACVGIVIVNPSTIIGPPYDK